MASYVQQYYKKLYTRDPNIKNNNTTKLHYLSNTPKVVTSTQNIELKHDITKHEVKVAMNSILRGKLKWIMVLNMEAAASIIINEKYKHPFKLERSVKQRCLLVPYLFFFTSNALGYMLDDIHHDI
uniref:Uncharacterized protein n=1 Tax=Physcomitrium patens TaxID=3218 RepID=A0A2K1IXW2_PHYPA|nr:hypothetical protein PHYPA_023918 [Physcomitrium patens]